MTMLFRSARDTDLDAIYQLAGESGSGMTTLPNDKVLLTQRLAWSTASFQTKRQQPANDYYLFVLEDTETKTVVGTSAIQSSVGRDTPFYTYELSQQTNTCPNLGLSNTITLLKKITAHNNQSELCTLFLNPSYRHKTNGLLLSRARFLFIAQFPERFETTLIAEMRGVCNEQGQSPFWAAVGSHFIPLSFAQADQLTLASNKQLIANLIPTHPIYVNLLPKSAQNVIGCVNQTTQAALNMLLREGFSITNHIDLLDAGPTVTASRPTIKTIATNQTLIIKDIVNTIESKPHIISNRTLDFRASLGSLLIENQTCCLTQETADVLQVKRGDMIRSVL